MNGKARGDASAEHWQERFDKERRETDLALTELDVRADMKSLGEEEVSDIIEREALERQRKKDSEPPSGKVRAATAVLRLLPEGWGRVIVVLAGIAALTFLAARGFRLF